VSTLIRVPCVTRDASRRPAEAAAPARIAAGRTINVLTRGTVLVVDDDARLLRVVTMYLSIEGYEVTSAADGPSALAALQAQRPDVVLMDIMMPGMDGIEACSRIRGQAETASIPVLLFSALSGAEDAERARLAGANHLITKPYNLIGLAAIVNSYCPVDLAPVVISARAAKPEAPIKPLAD
jgi:CheY-like chemotaxis protein